MGKIVKYCSSCDEGFAERFTFCPDCGATLQAYEMNPLGNAEPVQAEAPQAEPVPAEIPVVAEPAAAEAVVEAAPAEEPYEEPYYEAAPEPEEEYIEEPAAEPAAAGAYYRTPEMHADEARTDWQPIVTHTDGDYYVTVIQEKNTTQRNVLLLGATAFMLSAVAIAWLVSLYQKTLDVASIGDEQSIAYLLDDVPMVVEEEKPEKKKDDDDGGGGGGGGREDKDPVSQGDLADQSPNPIRPPDAKVPRLTNPSLVLPPPTTQGNMKFEKKYDRWGDPNAALGPLSNGPGTGGGMGTGTGTGQGSGTGTGTGSGSGSGYGGGVGNGNGDGTGDGSGGPPPRAPAVTTNYRILSTPKATYTDEARQKNIQGAVRLKITLLANGQIGPITPVTRLPFGLTEQAIAAARRIQFEPKKVNGVPQSVVITREYTFTIY